MQLRLALLHFSLLRCSLNTFSLLIFIGMSFGINTPLQAQGAASLQTQESATIQGHIVDKDTGDPLPAYVSIVGTDLGLSADYEGFFQIELGSLAAQKTLKISIYFVGYQKNEMEIRPGDSITVEMILIPMASHEVIVTADSLVSEDKGENLVTLDKMDVYTLPGTAADPLYASVLLPGVNSVPDSSSILIRGGGPEEVGYFFDGIEIQHPFMSESLHESYFSIFDNQIVDGLSVSTSGYPPRFGDALSGVLNIAAKDGRPQREGGVGLSIFGLNSYIGLPLNTWGNLVTSFNLGHSYLLTRINGNHGNDFKTGNGFGKLKVRLNRSNTLRILGLFDTYRFAQKSGFNTHSDNAVGGLALTTMVRPNLVSNLTLSAVGYGAEYALPDIFRTEIKDRALQAAWNASLDLESHYLEFGGDFQNRNIEVQITEPGNPTENYPVQGDRWGLFLNDRVRLTRKLYLDLGGRLNLLRMRNSRWSFDPRGALAYFITRRDILRFSAGSYHQYGDYFTLAGPHNLLPKNALHFSLSYDRITPEINMRVTAYDKEYRNLFLNSINSQVNNFGRGFARGAEFYLKLIKRKFDILTVYNYLYSKRKEYDVLFLAPSPYDITHSFTGILTWKFNQGTLGFRFSYATGLPYTPLMGREGDPSGQSYIPIWGSPFSARQPHYQRIDLNGSRSFNFQNRMIVLYFGVTNLLDRNNLLRFDYSEDYSIRNNQYSIFGRTFFIGVYVPLF
ncbi:MAG: hypothetical protein GQ544_02500 [Candidatus Aminicenantes bacterium]|nr:hypothetical protein [Candidatus Aminicenantes bacterium]